MTKSKFSRSHKAASSFTATFDSVSSGVDTAKFNKELKTSAKALAGHLKNKARAAMLRQTDEQKFWQARNLLAEVYDHFGARQDAEAITAEASKLKDRLAAMKEFDPGETFLVRTQLRHVLFWGQVEYRNQQLVKAAEIIKFCEEFIKRLLEYERKEGIGDWPHWGTQGLISYFLGRVYRHQNRLDEAAVAFEDSIYYYYQRARHSSAQDATAYSHYRVAKALALGVGWVKLAQGHYREALRQNLIPASVLLATTEDHLNKQRVFLLEATAERALAGSSREKLVAIVGKLVDAMKEFSDHPHYRAKAARELCLAYVDLGQFAEAAANLEVFLAARSGVSYECDHKILSSLVELGRFEQDGLRLECAMEAVKYAQSALKWFEDDKERADHILVRIEAHITLGCAYFAALEFEKAKVSLMAALSDIEATSKGSPNTLSAACYLHLARTYVKLGQADQANRYLRRWEEIGQQVEHETLRALARRVSKEVAEIGGFVIAPADAFLDYKSRKHQLQRFLSARAKSSSGGEDAEIAKMLGVSVPGLRKWKEDFEEESKIAERLKDLCNGLTNSGEHAVFEIQRLLAQHGAYSFCRMVLHSDKDSVIAKSYEKIFRLAKEKQMENNTVEAIVTDNKANYRLFDDGEIVVARKRLDRG